MTPTRGNTGRSYRRQLPFPTLAMLTARQWKMSPLEVGCGSFSNMLPASSVSSEKERLISSIPTLSRN